MAQSSRVSSSQIPATEEANTMLFAAIYSTRGSVTEELQKRGLQLFTNWTPPFELKAHYTRCDGKGGVAIIESDSAEAIVEGVSVWVPFFDFDVTPVMPAEEATPITQRAYAWRDSVR
jgi:hypothetical protein